MENLKFCLIAAMLIADLKPRKNETAAPTSAAAASIHKRQL